MLPLRHIRRRAARATVSLSSPIRRSVQRARNTNPKPVNLGVARDLAMARPGLEPGTPRFSVVRSRLSNGRELPANKPISVRDARGRIFVNSILLPPIREMEGASSPNTTPRPESTSQRSRPRPRRAGSILATPRRRSKRLPTAGQRQGDLGADAGARARRTVDDQGAGQSGYAVLQAGEPAAG
jgi:hypothetical protein